MVTGNKFRSINGNIDRAERVDTSFADLDYSRSKHVNFTGNSDHSVVSQPMNPLRVEHSENSPTQTWQIGTDGELPFEAWARNVDAVVANGKIKNAAGQTVYGMPYVQTQQGSNKDEIQLIWPEPVEGEVIVTMRIDA